MEKAKKNSNWIVVCLLAAVMMIAAAIFVYIGHLRNTLTETVMATSRELLLHDMKIIQMNMDHAWGEIEAVTDRIRQGEKSDISDLLRSINIERSASAFEQLYLVDEEGTTYSSYGLIYEDVSQPYIQRILNGEQRIATLYSGEEEEYTALEKDRIVYGTWVEPIQAGDTRIIGIIGLESIKYVEDELNVESFGGRGYTGVIDDKGQFVVNVNQGNGLGNRDNFYEMLETGVMSSDMEPEEIKSRITARETFSISCVDEEGEDVMVLFSAIPDSKWTILMSVQMEVFHEINGEFIRMTGILLAVVAVIFVLMCLVIIKSTLSQGVAKADAKAKSSFLSSMSHEIRTPLNGLIGLIHLMGRHMQEPDKMKNYLDKASSTARYLLTLVNDILDMQKITQEGMELSKEPVDVVHLIESTEILMRERMEANGITFLVESHIEKPEIMGDSVRIQQVLLNILSNAAKFTPLGGTVCMRIMQKPEKDKDRVLTVFEISDTGCGMSEEFQKHIFDSFTQEQNKSSDGTKGTGLGMAISYQLVRLMGGTIQVESSLGEGSIFTVELPAEYREKDKENKEKDEKPEINEKERSENRGLHILIAEDNDLNAEIVMEIFENEGYHMERACNGREAVEMFGASEPGRYDVILMDVQMPVMNGYDAAKAIRQMKRPDAGAVKIFACTANTFKEDKDRALASGMNDFIAKPIDPDKILEKF